MKYQLAILGGGPAGYTAAEKASKAGMDVVLFEQNALGGTCLNVGCIPTKTLLYSAKQYYNATHADKYGVKAENVTFDYAKIVQRKQKVVRKLVAGIKQKLNNEHCTVVTGSAAVVSRTDEAVVMTCNGEQYEAENLLICTGSVNFVPPIPGVKDNPAVWDSTDALAATQLPQSMIIVGGGVIGMEFATLYHELGVPVTVIEAMPTILPNLDQEVVSILRDKYTKAGIKILTATKVMSLDGNKVCAETAEGEKLELEAELAHVASRQAEVAVGRMLKEMPVQRIAYNAIPSVVYTNPEIASVGITEQDMDCEVRKIPMTFSGRFVAENEGETGLVKVLIDKKSHTVLGVHMIGNPCSEFVAAASFAVRMGYTVPEFMQVVFPHPTVSEVLREAVI